MADYNTALDKLDKLRKELVEAGREANRTSELYELLTHKGTSMPDLVIVQVGGYEVKLERVALAELVREAAMDRKEAVDTLVERVCPPYSASDVLPEVMDRVSAIAWCKPFLESYKWGKFQSPAGWAWRERNGDIWLQGDDETITLVDVRTNDG